MLTQTEVITIIRDAVMTTLVAVAPLLIVAMVVGLLISIFQATTQINDQTLAYVPKIAAVFVALIIFGAFIMTHITDYIANLYHSISMYLS